MENKKLLYNKYLKILGLKENISISDIKKAYKKIAKKNHPDKFLDNNDKIRQSIIMANITEAYNYLLKNYNNLSDNGIRLKEEKEENDYIVYMLALSYYNKYFDTFFKLFSKRELITPDQKKKCLQHAIMYFNKLIVEYPDSEWIFDVKKKMKKIKNVFKTLN